MRGDDVSVQEHIFFRAKSDHAAVADSLAEVLGMTVIHGYDGKIFVSRAARGDSAEEVGGEVYPNLFADPSAQPDEESLLDSYDTVLDVGYTGRDREVQMSEARALFDELAAQPKWPMALVEGLEMLIAAWDPALGLRWFPPHTTPDPKDRAQWEEYRRSS